MGQFDSNNGGGQPGHVAVISSGVVITGNVECDSVIQISGRVDGEVRCTTVFIDEGGIVDGAIQAERLRVAGIASGTITANDLAVEAGGTVSGQASYERLKVASGGIVEGTFSHRARQDAGDGESPLKLVKPKGAENPRRVYVD